jgi:small subunit ribosomal protein S20
VKAVESAVEAKDKDLAKGAFKNAESALDGMASKKVIHKNKAARIKSRLNKKVKAL